MTYVWIALSVLAIVLEALTVQLLFIWFLPGLLVAMILAFLAVDVWIQVLVFFLVSVACLVLFHTVLKKRLRGKNQEKFNVDAVIGEKCYVVEKIDNIACRGAVKVKGLEWAARTLSDDELLEEGTLVQVLAVEGVKLICKKIEK